MPGVRSNRIVTKLKLLVVLPLILISIASLYFAQHAYKELSMLQQTKKNLRDVIMIADTITELQEERGISGGYLSGRIINTKILLQKQRKKSDEILKKLHHSTRKEILSALAVDLTSIRSRVDQELVRPSEAFFVYTAYIQKLINNYVSIVNKAQNKEIIKAFSPYGNLMIMQEAMGKMRGSFSAMPAVDIADDALFYVAMQAQEQYSLASRHYYLTSPQELLLIYKNIEKSSSHQWVIERISKYLVQRSTRADLVMNDWFRKSTEVINQLVQLQDKHLAMIQKTSEHLSDLTKQRIYANAIIILSLFFLIAYLGYKIKNNILRQIVLLGEYRQVVDRSTIVSKTDIRGRVTYANQAFCSISGYTRKELIGKAHNIVRHPDMPKIVFKEMWETILAKKPWRGVMKNRKKDGDSYVVEATISPILNHRGEIEEFIAIRNDITEIIALQKEIEDTQREIILKMGEIGETHSEETGYHVKRVATYSGILARYYGLDEEEIERIIMASPMHDIGKVGIADSILNKPDKLTESEFEIMKSHTEIGYRLFRDSSRELLKTAAIISHSHHEKYDGSGYPQGLSGESIPISGRITALADVFDALGSRRCYKEAWNDSDIFAYIEEERGKHFDPKLVDIFFAHLNEFLAVREEYRDIE